MKSFDWKEFLWSPKERILSKILNEAEIRNLGHEFDVRGLTRTVKFVYTRYVPTNAIGSGNRNLPPQSGYWLYQPDTESTPYEFSDIVIRIVLK